MTTNKPSKVADKSKNGRHRNEGCLWIDCASLSKEELSTKLKPKLCLIRNWKDTVIRLRKPTHSQAATPTGEYGVPKTDHWVVRLLHWPIECLTCEKAGCGVCDGLSGHRVSRVTEVGVAPGSQSLPVRPLLEFAFPPYPRPINNSQHKTSNNIYGRGLNT